MAMTKTPKQVPEKPISVMNRQPILSTRSGIENDGCETHTTEDHCHLERFGIAGNLQEVRGIGTEDSQTDKLLKNLPRSSCQCEPYLIWDGHRNYLWPRTNQETFPIQTLEDAKRIFRLRLSVEFLLNFNGCCNDAEFPFHFIPWNTSELLVLYFPCLVQSTFTYQPP